MTWGVKYEVYISHLDNIKHLCIVLTHRVSYGLATHLGTSQCFCERPPKTRAPHPQPATLVSFPPQRDDISLSEGSTVDLRPSEEEEECSETAEEQMDPDECFPEGKLSNMAIFCLLFCKIYWWFSSYSRSYTFVLIPAVSLWYFYTKSWPINQCIFSSVPLKFKVRFPVSSFYYYVIVMPWDGLVSRGDSRPPMTLYWIRNRNGMDGGVFRWMARWMDDYYFELLSPCLWED